MGLCGWCWLLYLSLGRKFLCSGSDSFRLGLRNRQVFFLFMTHCNITWNGYKAKPLTPLRGHLRATSNLGIQSTQIYFPSHRKQIKFFSVWQQQLAPRASGSCWYLVFTQLLDIAVTTVVGIASQANQLMPYGTAPQHAFHPWQVHR